jgi:hypothetical protein
MSQSLGTPPVKYGRWWRAKRSMCRKPVLFYNKVLPVPVFMASMLHRPGGFLCRAKHGSRSLKTKWHARTVGVKKP